MTKWQAGTIEKYYPMAMAEGEGVGTAYEYVAKERRLGRFLEKVTRGSRILVAGIPERYGYSLDFVSFAARIGAPVTVVDDRPERLEMSKKLAEQVLGAKVATGIDYVGIRNLESIGDLSAGWFDLALSCEVIQRLRQSGRKSFAGGLASISGRVGLFAPNGDNPSHANRSGLKALRLEELICAASSSGTILDSGYTDMPPFPPGIKRNDQQRAQVLSSGSQRALIRGLELWCHVESFLPRLIQKKFCHIVYVMLAANNAESRDGHVV
jgi:hypothetical protein